MSRVGPRQATRGNASGQQAGEAVSGAWQEAQPAVQEAADAAGEAARKAGSAAKGFGKKLWEYGKKQGSSSVDYIDLD